jgi:hypothetical protein
VVIVTCYNQVKSRGRKRKGKYSRNSFSFLFARGSEFLYRWKRVKLQLDLAWYDNTMKNQDVTWTGPVECLVLLTTV